MLPEVESPAVGQDVKVVKTRKPRQSHKAVELRLGAPTSIDGSKDTTLAGTVGKKFTKIVFLKPDGKTTHAIIHDTENSKNVKNPGTSLLNFTYAVLNAALSGQGLSPDGSASWVAKNYPAVLKAHPDFARYILVAVPAGRSGLSQYAAPIKQWVALIEQRAAIIGSSLKAGKVKAHVTRPTKSEKPEKVEVQF